MKVNVEHSMMNSNKWCVSFCTSNDARMGNVWRKVVWVQGYWNWMGDNSTPISSTTGSVSQNKDYSRCMKPRNILIFDFIYFVGEILDDDVISTYLNGIIYYFGKSFGLENGNLKKQIGAIIVKKEKLQIQEKVVSVTGDIACGLDGKNLECYEGAKILTILIFSCPDCGDKAFDLAFIILSIINFNYSNELINCTVITLEKILKDN